MLKVSAQQDQTKLWPVFAICSLTLEYHSHSYNHPYLAYIYCKKVKSSIKSNLYDNALQKINK